ncbi:MAG TPA: cupin domain-containing protein [Rubrobacteraceae bacterium]|nr:cupin domain-containing protein [Rubrobacteraceae bacterium]
MEPELGALRYTLEHARRDVAGRGEPGPGAARQGITRLPLPLREEEWVFVIPGRGVAEIDGEEFEVGAGDFMGFPAPQVAHHLRNPGDEDLVYLVGGENLEVDIADFPRLGKRMLRRGKDVEIYDVADAMGFGPLDV